MPRTARLRGWAAAEGGATAVEFAIIGPLFLLLVMSCIEIGIELMTQLDLDNAVQAATRNVMIGGDATKSAFVADVCSHASALLSNCSDTSSALMVNVTTSASFAALTPATIAASGALSSTSFPSGAIGPNQAVLVQVAYKRPWDVPWLNTLTGGASTLLSTVTTMTEPSTS